MFEQLGKSNHTNRATWQIISNVQLISRRKQKNYPFENLYSCNVCIRFDLFGLSLVFIRYITWFISKFGSRKDVREKIYDVINSKSLDREFVS
jgi:hypothetical protein